MGQEAKSIENEKDFYAVWSLEFYNKIQELSIEKNYENVKELYEDICEADGFYLKFNGGILYNQFFNIAYYETIGYDNEDDVLFFVNDFDDLFGQITNIPQKEISKAFLLKCGVAIICLYDENQPTIMIVPKRANTPIKVQDVKFT